MARPEVVDRHLDAEGVQLGEDGRGQFHVVHGKALRDLEAQLRRIDRGGPHHAGDLLGQSLPLELPRREVHPDPETQPMGLVPRPGLETGPLEDGTAYRQDRAVVLGQLDELCREQDAMVRMVPTDQRLGPDDAAIGE